MNAEPNEEERAWSEWAEEGPGLEEEPLERAWAALDEGDPERALHELSGLDPDWPDRWIPEALALTELGHLTAARTALDRVKEIADVADHPDWLWAEGCLRLAEWRIAEARTALEHLVHVERTIGALERLSLCLELQGDFASADRLLHEAHAIDPDALPLPTRFDTADFEHVIATAIDELPDEFKAPLETTEIIVEPVPGEWMIDHIDPSETPPDLLGLFVGPSEIDRTSDDSGHLPRRIFLFQRNLERGARDETALVEEIRTTLFHEIGHMLGFDEAGVAEMGLE